MNEIDNLLELIGQKMNCKRTQAIRWLADQAGVGERIVWYWIKGTVELSERKKKLLGRIAEDLKKGKSL